MIEVAVSTLLVATVLLASISASANLRHNHHDAHAASRGRQLAAILLDEVSAKNFRDSGDEVLFGLESDESSTDRTTFDDVDDYEGYQDAPPHFHDGTTVPGYEGWQATFTVRRAEVAGESITITTDDDAPLRLVTVTCTAPDSTATIDSVLVSSVPSDLGEWTSHTKLMRTTLTFSAGREISVAVPLRNQPEAVDP